MMEFLVETTIRPPDGAGELDGLMAEERRRAAELAADGVLVRLWRPADRAAEWKNIGVWSALDRDRLADALDSLPMRAWMSFVIRELDPHPSDPAGAGASA